MAQLSSPRLPVTPPSLSYSCLHPFLFLSLCFLCFISPLLALLFRVLSCSFLLCPFLSSPLLSCPFPLFSFPSFLLSLSPVPFPSASTSHCIDLAFRSVHDNNQVDSTMAQSPGHVQAKVDGIRFFEINDLALPSLEKVDGTRKMSSHR